MGLVLAVTAAIAVPGLVQPSVVVTIALPLEWWSALFTTDYGHLLTAKGFA